MQKKSLAFIAALFLCAAVVLSAGCVTEPGNEAQVEILYAGVGNMPQLMHAGSIDAAMTWQPFVAVMEEAQLGKTVALSNELPPEGKWEGHTCCVFGANSEGLANDEITADLIALMSLGSDYIAENPDKSAELIADWIFAGADMKYGDITVNSLDVEKTSIPTILFSAEVTENWLKSNEEFVQEQRDLGIVTGKLLETSSEETRDLLFDLSAYEEAEKILETGKFLEPEKPVKISIGHLLSDHSGPLHVLLKDWKYFQANYNAYLKPVTEKAGDIKQAELYVNGKKAADITLVSASAGPALMTSLQQNNVQYAIAGTPPFISAVDKATDAVNVKIVAPIMMNGSGLVVKADSPATDWDSFVQWVKDRSAEGKPVVIADPQLGSIQDVQLKGALESAGIGYTIKSA